MYYIHKHQVALQYGGPEEGGWWYTSGVPVNDWVTTQPHHCFNDEDTAYLVCRYLNEHERLRRKRDEQYDFTSVLAKMSEHFEYSVEDFPEMTAYPAYRPHYE